MSLKALSYGNSGRRQFLQAVLTSAAVAAAAQAGFELANPEEVIAQTNLTPDAALQELLAGNRRFAADQMTPSTKTRFVQSCGGNVGSTSHLWSTL